MYRVMKSIHVHVVDCILNGIVEEMIGFVHVHSYMYYSFAFWNYIRFNMPSCTTCTCTCTCIILIINVHVHVQLVCYNVIHTCTCKCNHPLFLLSDLRIRCPVQWLHTCICLCTLYINNCVYMCIYIMYVSEMHLINSIYMYVHVVCSICTVHVIQFMGH